MKPIPDEVRAALCRRIGVDDGALSFLGGGRGDSDGIVYRTGCGRGCQSRRRAMPSSRNSTSGWSRTAWSSARSEANSTFFLPRVRM